MEHVLVEMVRSHLYHFRGTLYIPIIQPYWTDLSLTKGDTCVTFDLSNILL